MANKTTKSSSSKSTATKSSSTKSTSTRSSGVWTLNKISFWTIVSVAVLYAISLILACVGGDTLNTVVRYLQGVATAIIIVVAAILAWRYVRSKQIVWKVLYVLCLLLVIVGIIVPLILI